MSDTTRIFAAKGPGYTMERHPHGVVFLGSVCLSMMDEVVAIAAAIGFDLVDFRLPSMLSQRWGKKVGLVVVSDESGAAWVAELEAQSADLGALDRFIAGRHCGISAQTIIWVLTGRMGSYVHSDRQASPPRDPADLTRCLHLLRAMPDWRHRLGEVAKRFPAWAGLVEHWDELVALLEEEVPGVLDGGRGSAPRTYARMRELSKQGVAHG